jgi:molybdopterin-guanine dinucleotide biosynthesis protein A
MTPLETMNAFILTGGKSTRMARDKALLTLGGKTFLDIIAERLATLFDRVYTAGRGYDTELRGDGKRLENVEDRASGAGPLAGIHAALHASDKECNFFVGVDYPLLEPELVVELARFTQSDGAGPRGVIPVAPDGPHPLFAFYCKSCLPGVERCLEDGFFQVLCIARHGDVRFVRLPDEVPALGLLRIERILTNVNRRSDYKKVKKIVKKKVKV